MTSEEVVLTCLDDGGPDVKIFLIWAAQLSPDCAAPEPRLITAIEGKEWRHAVLEAYPFDLRQMAQH